jgi:hypothetical protein
MFIEAQITIIFRDEKRAPSFFPKRRRTVSLEMLHSGVSRA